MAQLKAVLFEINGVFINDSAIQFELIDELLLSENLRPTDQLFRNACLIHLDTFFDMDYP